jgi:hypothetical protein
VARFGEFFFDFVTLSMAQIEVKAVLSGMPGLSRYTAKQRGTAGNRFAMALSIHQPYKKTPAIVNQRDQPCHDLTTFKIASGKAGPSPLVFKLVERILVVGSIPIKLANGSYHC